MVFEFDHTYPSATEQSNPTAILFGTIGTREFLDLHSFLRSEADSSRLRYIFRHLVPTSEDKVALSGYGVELAIKSLEYKSVDDSKVEGTR
jgi:UDP-glucose:glycoprotein glucosyltransferase